MGKLRIITYKGRTVKTTVYKEMSEDLFKKLREEFYKKPAKEKVGFKYIGTETYKILHDMQALKTRKQK